jgi:DNA-binding MarR family transcriptional regulator
MLEYRTAYTAGVLQSKAFRILKKKTNEVLEPLDVNATDWGILGLLMREKAGLRLSELSREVGVKAPYITKSIDHLEKKDFVCVQQDSLDSRARIAVLTPAGKKFVINTEKLVVRQLKIVFKNVSTRDMYGYVKTLDTVVRDFSEVAKTIDLQHINDF